MTLEDIKNQPPGVLDQLPVDVLAAMQTQAEQAASDAAGMLAILHGVFSRRYATGLNETGTSKRVDGEYTIKITVPKNVSWDQDGLAKARAAIAEWENENPDDYVDAKYSVAESKYAAWPESLKALFTPARTVKPGKAKFELIKQEVVT